MSVRTYTINFLGRTFSALKHPNYRRWFAGQMLSLVGTWMQSTAQAFLIYELTQSPEYLGYVGLANGIPTWFFMLFAGVIADRVARRNLILVTQSAMLILAFILAALTFTGIVQPWHILLLAFLLGTANAFDAPARLAFVPELVVREDLTNAIALNATMFNTATAFGPAVAGLTYYAIGPAWCFTLNGISFLAVIAALLNMRLPPYQPAPHNKHPLTDLQSGLKYVIATPVIRTLIMLIAAISIFGLGYVTLFPAWAVEILKGNELTNGWLQSARGIGSLLGALMIASLGRFKGKGQLMSFGSLLFPIIVLIFAWVRWLPLSLLMLGLAGWSYITMVNLCNALVQTHTPDNLRGRVMSVYSFSFFGFMPIGAFLAGQLAVRFGEPLTVTLGASIMLCIALLTFFLAPNIRALE
jgi:MFS family permease